MFSHCCFSRRRNPRIGIHSPPPSQQRQSIAIPTALDDGIRRFSYESLDLNSTWNIPKSAYCPITYTPMKDPVLVTDGYSYERDAITHWMQREGSSDGVTSPVTGAPLVSNMVIPNHTLRHLISEIVSTTNNTTILEPIEERVTAPQEDPAS